MLLHFGRNPKAQSAQIDVDSDTPVAGAVAVGVVAPTPASGPISSSSSPSPSPVAKRTPASPPRSPSSSSPKRISPLRVQIPDADDDFSGIVTASSTLPPPPSNVSSVRRAELTLDVSPPSPPSSPPSALSSPQPGRLSKQSHMRGLSVMSYRLKQLVSKEKRRFDGDGFNLDLTYVTDRLIAFGYPAENLEGMYRNHYKDVYHFFERRHATHYKIYNLCAERTYDKEKFHHRVAEYPFHDHCPPPLSLFLPFCYDVAAWLQAEDQHVAAIHCKAGKGRTGVMICAYLLFTRAWTTAYGAMEFFGAARSLKREGVTIPSQQRFIRYFASMCQDAAREDGGGEDAEAEAVRELSMKPEDFHQLWEETIDGRGLCLSTKRTGLMPLRPTLPPTVRLVLTRIRINGVYAHKRMDPRVRIECGSAVYEPLASFSSGGGDPVVRSANTPASPHPLTPTSVPSTPSSTARDSAFWSTVSIELSCERLLVWDEVKIALRHRTGTKLGHFWFHTSFVPTAPCELTVLKDEIDKIYKDSKKGHKLYAADFSITLVFEHATAEDTAGVRATRRAHSTPDAIASPSLTMTPPATPTRQRPFASMNNPTNGGHIGLDLRQLFGGSNGGGGGGPSPSRTRAVSDQAPSMVTPFASVVALVAEDETTERSPSASRISTSSKVSPTNGKGNGSISGSGVRSVPSSPRNFSRRFFGLGKRDMSVSASVADAAPNDSDDSSSSSTHS